MAARRKAKPKKKTTPKLRSGFEKKIKKYLDDLGVSFEYETERIKYEVPIETHTYTPDFKLPNGVIVEAKGKLDRGARKKMALVAEQHPDKDIRILFMRDNPINKGSKTKYSDWARKRGIKFHISAQGHIPMEWINE